MADAPIEFSEEVLDSLSSGSIERRLEERERAEEPIETTKLLGPEHQPLEGVVLFDPNQQYKSASSKSDKPSISALENIAPVQGALIFLRNQLGPDIFALPYLFFLGGIFPTFIIIILAAILYNHTLIRLLESADRDSSEKISLLELGRRIVGPKFRKTIAVVVLIAQFTVAITNYIFLYQFVDRISCNLEWSFFCNSRIETFMFVYALLFVILLLKSYNRTHLMTMWIAIITSVLLLVVFIDDFVVMFSASGAKGLSLVGSNPSDLLIVVGVAFYFIEGTNTVTNLYATSDDPNQTAALIFRALYVIVFVYSLFGFPGYLAYGTDTQMIMILNLGVKPFWVVTQWVIWFFFLLSASDGLVPFWKDLRSWIKKREAGIPMREGGSPAGEAASPEPVANFSFERNVTLFCLKALTIGAVLLIASFITDFVTFMSLAGNFMLVWLVAIIPLTIYQYGSGSHQSTGKIVLRIGLIVLSCILGKMGICYCLYRLIVGWNPSESA